MPVAVAAIDADRARIQAGYLLGRENAGTILIYSPYLLHHLSDFYPDPDRF